MTPDWSCSDVDIYVGDSRTMWRDLPEQCADALITSPPYFGLRDYGVDGQIGLEATPQEYIDSLADLLTGYARCLKRGGSMWLNLADTYSASSGGRAQGSTSQRLGRSNVEAQNLAHIARDCDMPAKCLLMIPERVALALISRGWILRNKVAWLKKNGMPSSARDRLATKWEYLFHFVREPKYFYDLDAIRERHVPHRSQRAGQNPGSAKYRDGAAMPGTRRGWDAAPFTPDVDAGVNPGDWWVIPTQPYPGAHYAVYPGELIRRPILATVPEQVCKKCGTGRERIVERGELTGTRNATAPKIPSGDVSGSQTYPQTGRVGDPGWRETVGWTGCGCDAGWQPGTVLDPFIGSGTTAQVARRFGRRCIGVDLDGSNIPLIVERLGGGQEVLDLGVGGVS